jgi:hypothetical protein
MDAFTSHECLEARVRQLEVNVAGLDRELTRERAYHNAWQRFGKGMISAQNRDELIELARRVYEKQ